MTGAVPETSGATAMSGAVPPTNGAVEMATSIAGASGAPGSLREFWLAYSQSRGALIGLALVLLLILLALFADVVSPHPPNEQYREFTLAPPMWHQAGSAMFIRDVYSRH
jgi:dipeptide transport system permease protein